MAYFPIRRYRLYDDPFDRFFGDQLDLFDPWNDFDIFPTALAAQPHAFRWVNQPQRLAHSSNRHQGARTVPQAEKFRVQLNVAGFSPESVKTRVDGRKVIVEAKQEDRQNDGDFSIREIRKSYDLPEHADASQLASYVTPNNMLVIEVPIRNPEAEKKEQGNVRQFGQVRDPLFDYAGFLGGSNFNPRIVDKDNNEKQLEITVPMNTYKPEEIQVSVKNNELIVQGEHRRQDGNRAERAYFFKSTKLPPGTQLDKLESHLTDDGQLKIAAPFVEQKEQPKAVEGQQNTNRA